MTDIFVVPIALVIILVMMHAWFGIRILQKGIIFTDLAIAQFAALGSAISLAYFHSEYFYALTLFFALLSAFLIAIASQRKIKLEAFIGLLYVLGASGIMMVLSHSSEGMEHFKSLLASDILFTPLDEVMKSSVIYAFIALILYKVYPKLTGFFKELMFFSLLAITVTSSVALAGVLVVFVLLIAPALVSTSLKLNKSLLSSFVFGWFFSISAIIISYYYDLPTGYTIVFLGALLSSIIVLFTSKKNRTDMKYPNEWTQKEFLENKIALEKDGIKVILVDTILSPIQKAQTTVYNPFELKNEPEGSVFVFYCDSGKATLDRLKEYKKKFPSHHCISLKGGRGYWRKNMMILDAD